MSAQLLTCRIPVSGSTRQLLQIFLWSQFIHVYIATWTTFTKHCLSSPFPSKVIVCTGPVAASWLCLFFQGRLLWMGKSHFFSPVLPCHTVTDWLTSLSLGHTTCFDCIFLTSLAVYLFSFPRGNWGRILQSLEFPHSLWKEEENQRWARKSHAEKDVGIWRRELYALGMKLPPGWPKAEQFTLFCKICNGLGWALRSKHFKGAWGGLYLYFYKVFGLLWVSGYIPIVNIGANLKWGSALWR